MMLTWKLLGILVLYLCAGGKLGTGQGAVGGDGGWSREASVNWMHRNRGDSRRFWVFP